MLVFVDPKETNIVMDKGETRVLYVEHNLKVSRDFLDIV